MDSNNILQSLANLREALQGIESAKNQVAGNVAAYEKVRAQLSNTADSVSTIVSEIQTLIDVIQSTESSFSDKLDKTSSQILDGLEDKGKTISAQSEIILTELESKLKDVTNQIETSVEAANSQLRELTNDKQQEIESIVYTIDDKLQKTIGKAQKDLSVVTSDFSKKNEQQLSNIEKLTDAQLRKLNSGVEVHLSKLSDSQIQIKDLIEKIKAQVCLFDNISSELSDKITKTLAETHDKFSQSLANLSDNIKNAIEHNENNLSQRISDGTSEQKKATEDAQTILMEQLKSTQETLTVKVNTQADALSSLIKGNKSLTIINIILMIGLIILIFLK